MGLNKRLIGAGAASGSFVNSENFKAVIYTGNGGTQAITGVGFKPDFVWIKNRTSSGQGPLIQDSTRGTGSTKVLFSSENTAEGTYGQYGHVSAFGSDGFTVVDGDGKHTNSSGENYVAWCWKANGGTTSTDTSGDINSTVQANTDAGFSITTYVTNGSNSARVGHGLGTTPKIVLIKKLGSTGAWHFMTTQIDGSFDDFILNDTTAKADSSLTAPNSTTFAAESGSSGTSMICYSFAEVDSFSKFGSYTGNSSDNGPIVETGFEPAFLMIKCASDAGSWFMYDNKRNTSNPRINYVLANAANAEASDMGGVDFLSNGFQIKEDHDDVNDTGDTYIYMAFAADPDTEAPTLASSFNIETWTGTGAAASITGFGFSPNLVWYKERSNTSSHELLDTLRGATNYIMSNSDAAQATSAQGLQSFDSDGFSVGTDGAVNQSGETYVGWTWKADDNEPTIFGGPAIAVYKFEDNANDVTGTYNATATNVTYSSSGKFNKAAEFNGSSSKINLPNNPIGTNLKGSVSLWVSGSSLTNTATSVNMIFYNTNPYIALDTYDSNLRLTVKDSSSSNTTISYATSNFNATDWYHIAYVFNGTSSTFELFVNGSSVGTATAPSSTTNVASAGYIGHGGNYQYFTGKIDQVRFYNGSFKAEQVDELYAETASQNDDLTLGAPPKSIVSANANAGFSIVKYDGTGANMKVPHGLSAVPTFIIVKNLTSSSAWAVFHTTLGATKYLALNETTAEATASNVWNDTAPTATTISVGTWGPVNTSANQHIAYCFHDVAGYQKFGSYTGNGGSKAITGLGFKPDFVLIKSTGSNSWFIYDALRTVSVGDNAGTADARPYILTNTNGKENGATSYNVDLNSDGFSMNTSAGDLNTNSQTYIYWAVAKNVPSNTTLASSFKAVAYTGNSGAQSITGTGFTPDLVWTKARNQSGYSHFLTDSLRGGTKVIQSNSDGAEITRADNIQSFDSDGFTLGADGTSNYNGTTYIAWAWKAGNTWQSNVDGATSSIVNANTANGFSIVKWVGTANSQTTVGHGLNSTPELIITKNLDTAANDGWPVYSSTIGNAHTLFLNSSSAKSSSSGTWGSTSPTSSVFTVQDNPANNQSGNEIIAYCFHSVSGYSKIGTYTGNGSARSITGLGFQPDWVLIKSTTQSASWQLFDSARGATNGLNPDSTAAEFTNTGMLTSFDSDGFSLGTQTSVNANTETYIYMAFKMN